MSDIENKWVEDQYKIWSDENDISQVEDISESVLKKSIEKDLAFVSKMTVQEYTLYEKWIEVHEKYPTIVAKNPLFGDDVTLKDKKQAKIISEVRKNIWTPESPDDIEKLEPVLEFTDDTEIKFAGYNKETGEKLYNHKRNSEGDDLSTKWNTLRTFLSTMKNNSNIGRQMFFIVKDNRSGKNLGVICISGDFMDLTPRDKFIGWDRQIKTFEGKINHTAIGSSIVPTQPLGYSFTGGKLLAYLCLSDYVHIFCKK